MKMNKKLIGVLACGLVVGGVSVYAASQLMASEIGFSSKHVGWSPKNLEEAVNDLYGKNNSNTSSTNKGYVQDGLVLNLDYKTDSASAIGFNAPLTEDGFSFDGTKNHILLKRYQNSSITYEVYFNPSLISGTRKIISSAENGGLYIAINSSSILGKCNYGGTYYNINSKEKIEVNKWYHVILSAGTDGMKLYVNGELQGQTNKTGVKSSNSPTITAIGAEPDETTIEGDYFAGNIKFARVYNRGLTEEEVLKNYNDTINNY